MDKTQRDSLFRASKIAMTYDGNRAFGIIADDRELVFGMMRSFGADGATPTHWTGGGAYALTMLKQTDDAAAIDRFLKVMNWLAAPFGSAESFIASYGAEGSDYTIEDGVAILTEQGQREQDLGFGYIAGGPQILCNPQGAPGVDTAIYEWQESVIPLLTGNPAQHLYSATQNSKGALARTGDDGRDHRGVPRPGAGVQPRDRRGDLEAQRRRQDRDRVRRGGRVRISRPLRALVVVDGTDVHHDLLGAAEALRDIVLEAGVVADRAVGIDRFVDPMPVTAEADVYVLYRSSVHFDPDQQRRSPTPWRPARGWWCCTRATSSASGRTASTATGSPTSWSAPGTSPTGTRGRRGGTPCG